MMRRMLSFLLIFCFAIGQPAGFAQAIAQLDVTGHVAGTHAPANSLTKFRPIHLRYLSYQPQQNKFRLLLDKGDKQDINKGEFNVSTQKVLEYFFIGLALPNDSFWVNLRPGLKDEMIDSDLAKTDVGKVLLEADVNLKKDTARFTSPSTPEGREYWDRLHKKAEELFGSVNIDIPTIARPWIVPDEILIRETEDGAYIYKAALKVMLEQDYLSGSGNPNLKDERFRKLNEYSAQLMREIIVPGLTREINSAQKYASLRQVYYSLILAQWFKQRFIGRYGAYAQLINARVIAGLNSKVSWSKDTYYQAYLDSIHEGEYNTTSKRQKGAQPARRYSSGGIQFNIMPMPTTRISSPIVQPAARIRFAQSAQIPRVELLRFSALVLPATDLPATDLPATLLVRMGNLRKIVPMSLTNIVPASIASGTSALDSGLDPVKLNAANLEAAEVDMGENAPLALFPAIPAINTNVAAISRGLQIDVITSQIKRHLKIIDTESDAKLVVLAQMMVETNSAEIAESKLPDLPGISKSEIKIALAKVASNMAASSLMLSVGEFKIIAAEIARLPLLTMSSQEIANLPVQQVPIIDVSNRKVPVSLGKITSVYNQNADRLTMQASTPVELMIAQGQKITVALPVGVENVVVAKMTLKGHPILLVSPVRSAPEAIADLFKTSMPVEVEYVRIIASPALAAKINKIELSRVIQAARLDIVVVEPLRQQKFAVVSDGLGAVIVESAGYTKIQPLTPIESSTALAVSSPILDLQAIRADMVRQLSVTDIANLAQRATFIKAVLTMKPTVEKQALIRLSALLDNIIQDNVAIAQGEKTSVSKMNDAAKISFIRGQSLPLDQQEALALAMNVEISKVVEISGRMITQLAIKPENVPQLRYLGGVDLRSMKIIAPAVAGPKPLSKSGRIDIETEGRQIQGMVHRGVVPSAQRVMEYALTVSQGANAGQISRAFGYLADILRLEEEQALPTRPELAEALVLLEL